MPNASMRLTSAEVNYLTQLPLQHQQQGHKEKARAPITSCYFPHSQFQINNIMMLWELTEFINIVLASLYNIFIETLYVSF